MTAALTILSGLALLVLGQIVIRSFIDPIYEVNKLRGEIANGLIYYANIYMNPGSYPHQNSTVDDAIRALRSLGSQLEVRSHAVPFYRFFAFVRSVPTLDSIERARSNLIGLSNSCYRGNVQDNEKRRQEIIKALNLRIPD